MFRLVEVSRIFVNQRGQSLVSNLIAGAIVTTAAAGTASLVQYLVTQSRKGQVLNRAVVQQSQLIAAVLRKDQFTGPNIDPARKQIIDNIKAGGSAKGFTLLDMNKNVVALAGSRIAFDKDGKACSGADCPILVDFDLRCRDLATEGCAAAYRVSINAPAGEVVPPALGTPYRAPSTFVPCSTDAPEFVCSDYALPVSYESMAMKSTDACQSDDVFVYGMNRVTGALRCAKKAAKSCPTGQIAKNVKLVYDDAGALTGHLEMACMDLAKPACPDQYVFERLEVRQLDPTVSGAPSGSPNGLCRYRWRNDIPPQTPLPAAWTSDYSSSSAAVCNTNVYDPVGGCGYQTGASSPGHCVYSCNCSYDNKGNVTGCQTCHSYPNSSASASQVSFDPSSGIYTCAVNVTHQCGSTMTATPTWNGLCRVKQPYLSKLTVAPVWQQ